MSRDKTEALNARTEEKLKKIQQQLQTVTTGEVFRRTNSVDNPKPHLPRAGELAMGFPDNPRRKK